MEHLFESEKWVAFLIGCSFEILNLQPHCLFDNVAFIFEKRDCPLCERKEGKNMNQNEIKKNHLTNDT